MATEWATYSGRSTSRKARLQLELDRRKLEQQKINMLDQKIEVELQEKKERMEQMEREVAERVEGAERGRSRRADDDARPAEVAAVVKFRGVPAVR